MYVMYLAKIIIDRILLSSSGISTLRIQAIQEFNQSAPFVLWQVESGSRTVLAIMGEEEMVNNVTGSLKLL